MAIVGTYCVLIDYLQLRHERAVEAQPTPTRSTWYLTALQRRATRYQVRIRAGFKI